VTDLLAPLAAPGAFPVPAGRGRWRLTIHRRPFSAARWDQTIIGELAWATSRELAKEINRPAELRFTIDGRSPDAAAITELATEVMAWRWDDRAGADVCAFRGVVEHSEDQLSEQSHTVNFVAHDYLATLARRFLLDSTGLVLTAIDQDQIAATLLSRGGGGPLPTAPFSPGSFLALGAVLTAADGTNRAKSLVFRDRTYIGQKAIGEAIDQLANISGGFGYDILPEPQADDALTMLDQNGTLQPLGSGRDALRIFWPAQGIARPDVVLVYGGSVASLTRSVSSSDYGNSVRSLGNNSSSDPLAAQLAGTASNADAAAAGVGWWPYADNAPSDVIQQATLDQRAAGLLAQIGVLVPSYSLELAPGAFSWGFPSMGDTVPFIVQSGRLKVNTTVRVVGLAFEIGDDGQEDVRVTVGRPLSSLSDLLARTNTAVDALARR
jgi:hypothetical protein